MVVAHRLRAHGTSVARFHAASIRAFHPTDALAVRAIMSKTVSNHVLERLAQWGIQRIYGYPGDGINGLMGALNDNSHGISFIQTRHEEMAAFMACAHAKFTGRSTC